MAAAWWGGKKNDTTPLLLKRQYEAELRRRFSRRSVEDPRSGQTAAMHNASLNMDAGELPQDGNGRIWVWSDLHFGHAEAPAAFGRPFSGPEDMDDAIFRTWEKTVAPEDTIVCLGDAASGALSGRTLKRVKNAPGRKILVFGNHDVRIDGQGRIEVDGFDEILSTLYAGGDPPLLMTHLPLLAVPEGCVNIHGHTQNAAAEGVERRINACVEHLEYRPAALDDLKMLAKLLAQEQTVWGKTTTDQLRLARSLEATAGGR